MGEERDVGAVFDDTHAESAEVFDLFLVDEGGAGAVDGSVEELGGWEAGFEAVDANEEEGLA